MSTENPQHRTDQDTPDEHRQRAYETAQHTLQAVKKRVESLRSKLDSARNAADRVRFTDQLRQAEQQEADAIENLSNAEALLEER